jgi:hypothetical protein
MNFYSARLLFIITVDDGKPKRRHDYNELVILFRARDFDHAFEKALELGKSRETTYKNYKNQHVRWALVEISTLDHVGRKIDGMEVASKIFLRNAPKPISAKQRFQPEKSKPGHSF